MKIIVQECDATMAQLQFQRWLHKMLMNNYG